MEASKKAPKREPANKEMWKRLDKHNQSYFDIEKKQKEVERLKEGIIEATIGFGRAMKTLQEKVDREQKEQASIEENRKGFYAEFQEEFGVSYGNVDWSKRV